MISGHTFRFFFAWFCQEVTLVLQIASRDWFFGGVTGTQDLAYSN